MLVKRIDNAGSIISTLKVLLHRVDSTSHFQFSEGLDEAEADQS